MVKGSLYHQLKREEDTLRKLTKFGVISTTWVRDLDIFDEYIKLDLNCAYCKYELVAEKVGLSSDRVKTIILKMKRVVTTDID